MANICDSRLTLEGDARTLDAVAALLAGLEGSSPFDLNTIAPVEHDRYDAHALAWGCGRNAGDVVCSRPCPGTLVYEFTTTWNPPRYAVEALAARYPSLAIELLWEDSEIAVCERIPYANGRAGEHAFVDGDLVAGAEFLARYGWESRADSWRNLLVEL